MQQQAFLEARMAVVFINGAIKRDIARDFKRDPHESKQSDFVARQETHINQKRHQKKRHQKFIKKDVKGDIKRDLSTSNVQLIFPRDRRPT